MRNSLRWLAGTVAVGIALWFLYDQGGDSDVFVPESNPSPDTVFKNVELEQYSKLGVLQFEVRADQITIASETNKVTVIQPFATVRSEQGNDWSVQAQQAHWIDDSASESQSESEVHFSGGVVIKQGTNELTLEQLTYFPAQSTVFSDGPISGRMRGSEIDAQGITLNLNDGTYELGQTKVRGNSP